jgi:opacity protein-like surface antigen
MTLPRAAAPSCLKIASLLALVAPIAHAQADVTASKSLGLTLFATAGQADTDYGKKNPAIAAGVDLALYPRWLRFVEPSLEGRLTFAPGSTVSETSIQSGLRISRHIRSFHPYADLLVGYGVLSLKGITDPSIAHTNAFTWNYGGGLDYDLHGPLGLKLDYQQQSWGLGSQNGRLTPNALTFGVTYNLFTGARHPKH